MRIVNDAEMICEHYWLSIHIKANDCLMTYQPLTDESNALTVTLSFFAAIAGLRRILRPTKCPLPISELFSVPRYLNHQKTWPPYPFWWIHRIRCVYCVQAGKKHSIYFGLIIGWKKVEVSKILRIFETCRENQFSLFFEMFENVVVFWGQNEIGHAIHS